jgi:hypothetical protein
MRILAAIACAMFVSVASASAQEATTAPDPRLAPMEAHYARIAQAYADNDPGMVLAYRTPDFYVELPGNVRIDYENAQRILLDFFSSSTPPIEASTQVLCAYPISETEAYFLVTQTNARTIDFEGTPRHVQSAVTQVETWRLTPEGWRLASISGMRDTRRWVDGVEINPAVAYEENAPAYVRPASAPVDCPVPMSATPASH